MNSMPYHTLLRNKQLVHIWYTWKQGTRQFGKWSESSKPTRRHFPEDSISQCVQKVAW